MKEIKEHVRKRERKKVVSLIYLWCNEGMLNASEHAVVVMLSGKMKCLHSRLSEEQRKEKMRKIRGGERRVAILQRGVNHLISTAPSHSPQNGYFVPSDGQHEEEGGLNCCDLISHLQSLFLNLNYSSYLWTPFTQHSAEWLFTSTMLCQKEFVKSASLFKSSFNGLVNYKAEFGFKASFFCVTLEHCINNNTVKWVKSQGIHNNAHRTRVDVQDNITLCRQNQQSHS